MPTLKRSKSNLYRLSNPHRDPRGDLYRTVIRPRGFGGKPDRTESFFALDRTRAVKRAGMMAETHNADVVAIFLGDVRVYPR